MREVNRLHASQKHDMVSSHITDMCTSNRACNKGERRKGCLINE